MFSTPYAIWKAQLFYGLFFSSTNDLVLHAYSDVNCTRDPLTVLQLVGIVSYYSRDALISLQLRSKLLWLNIVLWLTPLLNSFGCTLFSRTRASLFVLARWFIVLFRLLIIISFKIRPNKLRLNVISFITIFSWSPPTSIYVFRGTTW